MQQTKPKKPTKQIIQELNQVGLSGRKSKEGLYIIQYNGYDLIPYFSLREAVRTLQLMHKCVLKGRNPLTTLMDIYS